MTEVLFYITLLALIIQCAYLAFISFKPANYITRTNNTASVTVLVCAKNEEDHIDFLIRTLLRQVYQNFHILIVDDQSTDETAKSVRTWQEQYPDRIKLFSILNKQYSGKKGAIWEVLPHIHSDIILFTDADCRPFSKNWIKYMISAFEKDKYDLVIGYSPVQKSKSIINQLQRMQNAWTAWQYFGFAYRGRPYMAVGRNWAVNTDFYKKHQNIVQHGHIPSGDDDLVFQSLIEIGTVNAQLHSGAWVITWQSNRWKQWWRQRMRHVKAGINYPLYTNLLLLLFPITVLLVFCVCLYFIYSDFFVGLAILSAQFAIWIIFGRNILKKLGQDDLIVKLPLLLPLELAFQAIVFLLTLFRKHDKWK